MTTSCLSFVSWTSSSMPRAPCSNAFFIAESVFSGASVRDPRCAKLKTKIKTLLILVHHLFFVLHHPVLLVGLFLHTFPLKLFQSSFWLLEVLLSLLLESLLSPLYLQAGLPLLYIVDILHKHLSVL